MPTNAIIAVEQADHDDVVMAISLTRLTTWMTHTAKISKGDVFEFGDLGIDFEVLNVRHKCQPPTGDISPVTTVTFKPHRSLYDSEIQQMLNMGFDGH